MGLAVFLIGLFKKTMLADSMGAFADIGFAPAHVASAGALTAWAAAVAYTLQIYFDFSAYCDMAIGISQMFNIRLPANFNSPYKACSVIDFWRRWHMTLSRFLRDYLYIPLGGNRHGAWRRHANLLATMLFGGLWHGAGWTFIVWGGLHGVYLVINHLWRAWGRISLPAPVGWLLTFLPVVLAWTVFRAPDLHSAGAMLWGMAGGRGMGQGVGLRQVTLIALLLAIALALPNLQQMMRGDSSGRLPNWLGWRPGTAWALACFGAFAVSLMQMTRVSPFLYFQF
jgi:D-alanyl-lipoteichoic acid acyltransferase DltB (MBOAT superfamily)